MLKIITLLTKIIVGFLIALLFSGCHYTDYNGTKGNGDITTETRNITAVFNSIDVSSGIEVVLEQTQTPFVSVEADANLQALIQTKVENGVLVIKPTGSYNSTKTPVVIVRMPNIEDLQASSSAEIKSTNVLKGNNININSSSGSEIKVNVEFENISIDASSGSTINASGKAIKLECVSSSGSSINAENLLANNVIADASSGASIKTHPILNLKAEASSGADVYYNNQPKSIEKSESSGGSVHSN